MPRHLEKVLANAERQLASSGEQLPSETLPLYKKFLKIEEHRLRLKHQAGGRGREICARRADLVDVLLRHVFAAAVNSPRRDSGENKCPLALLALGGYGRAELNPSSDVDVMFVHRESSGKIAGNNSAVIEQVLYLLWDIGFKVGHSTRSIDEAIEQANAEMLTKTALLEARFLAGDAALAREFREEFRNRCVVGQERDYVAMRMQDQAARHEKFGDSVYMQEPNVKSGCGGLRDYQNLLWISYFEEGALTTTYLVGKDWLTESEQRRIDQAYDFLLRIRTDLHYATRRATDVLHLNLQEQIATRLDYRQPSPVLRSEALMKDYYAHTRDIFRVTERITERYAHAGSLGGARSLFSSASPSGAQEEPIEEFVRRDDQLDAPNRMIFAERPELMMRAFQIAQDHDLDLSPQLSDLIARNLGRVTKVFRYAKAPREIFEQILSRKGKVGRILRLMHRTDFLGRYVPEFGQLTCLVQHEFFHRYTADEHTLVCIEKLDALANTGRPALQGYRALLAELDDPLVLYLALLLHDTGKAVGARPHSEASAVFAQRAALRLQLKPERRRSLILLVDHHVTLSNTAQQRNVDDPATAVEFAQIVKDKKNLDALMLLTLADGQGTSAESWSDWKEALVWQLHTATADYLNDQGSFFFKTRIERESWRHSVAELLPPDFADEIEAHFEFMPDNYFRAFNVPDIASHIRLFRQFLEQLYLRDLPALTPAIRWEIAADGSHSVASACTWDGQQLLAKLAGSFSIVPINILSADVFTRGDNVVLDVFRVADVRSGPVTDPREMKLFESTLRKALVNMEFDFAPLLEVARRKVRTHRWREIDFPTHITVENKAHPDYTLVQIQTPDRVGLLYDLLCVFGEASISIALSRISTEKGAAIDTFYVTDVASRGKITDASRIAAFQRQLQEAALGQSGARNSA